MFKSYDLPIEKPSGILICVGLVSWSAYFTEPRSTRISIGLPDLPISLSHKLVIEFVERDQMTLLIQLMY